MLLEAFVIGRLSRSLDAPVYAEVPDAYPSGPFVILERTGGWKTQRVIPGAPLAVQSYGRTMLEAMELNERVKAAMEEMAAEPEIGSCRLNSDYNFTDPATKRYRYQAVFDVTYYD